MSLLRYHHFSFFPYPQKDYIQKSVQMEPRAREHGNKGWKERQSRNENRRLLINGLHRMNIWFSLLWCFPIWKHIVLLYWFVKTIAGAKDYCQTEHKDQQFSVPPGRRKGSIGAQLVLSCWCLMLNKGLCQFFSFLLNKRRKTKGHGMCLSQIVQSLLNY